MVRRPVVGRAKPSEARGGGFSATLIEVSFFHRCAVGYFDPAFISVGDQLRAVRSLPRNEVDAIVREHLGEDDLHGARPACFWRDEYVVVEHIALGTIPRRVELVRALMNRLGAIAVEIIGDDIVRAEPWEQP
jgi:hypothetical protein